MTSILIQNGTVIPIDGTHKVYDKGYVSIEEGRIVSVGAQKSGIDLNSSDYDIVINAKGKAILPGLVNAHTHLATECFRGIVDVLPGFSFTFVVKNFIKDNHLYDFSLAGCLELIRFGTTCTGDNYQRSSIIAKAFADSGLRGVLSEQISQANLLEGIYPSIYKYQPDVAEKEIKANDRLIEIWHGANKGRIICGYGPHAPDTMTKDILTEIKSKADDKRVIIMIHIAQGLRELDMMRLRHRKTSVEYLDDVGILGPRTIGAHCIHMTQKDLEMFKKSGTHLAHCPNIFIRRGRSTPLIPWLNSSIKNIGIGSDNVLHDPFENMRYTIYGAYNFLQSHGSQYRHLIPTPFEVLEMATIGSARGLGLEKEIGSLEGGKKADVIIVDMQKPHLTPKLDVVANLVHYANGNDVETTIVDGEILMDKRVIKTVDESEVLENGDKSSKEVWENFSSVYPQFPEVSDNFKYFK
jgi:5-methylthioadenosine/S-adenosylhomocysteine deaminase